MNVIGLHTSFNSMSHDPNVALISDGKLIYAAEEERFLRYKTSSGRFQSMHSKPLNTNQAKN